MSKGKELHTFVLHDESVNTHGFRMLTSGADLTEFRKNPVMLLNHNDWELPIGRWKNIRIEGDKILAEADFDMADEQGGQVARKVAEGYLKSCSIGAWAIESNDAPELRLEGQKYPTITRWQVREASICTIGANHNALALYDAYGGKINMESDTDIETVIQLIDNPKRKETMNRDLLNLLSLSDSSTEQDVVGDVKQVLRENAELQEQLDKIHQAEQETRRAEAIQLTDEAITAGRLHASARESTLKLFEADHEATKTMLSALPQRRSVASQLRDEPKSDKLRNMSWSELDQAGKLLELQEKDPELYAEKFREQYGRDPQSN